MDGANEAKANPAEMAPATPTTAYDDWVYPRRALVARMGMRWGKTGCENCLCVATATAIARSECNITTCRALVCWQASKRFTLPRPPARPDQTSISPPQRLHPFLQPPHHGFGVESLDGGVPEHVACAGDVMISETKGNQALGDRPERRVSDRLHHRTHRGRRDHTHQTRPGKTWRGKQGKGGFSKTR